MDEAVTLGVEEIQLYRLKLEAYGDFQGPIKHFKQLHPEAFPSAEEAIVMKQAAVNILAEHGYHENLRRVYSRQRKHYSHYAHNQCCMLYDEIGLGLTAFSSLRDRFALNTQSFDDYYAAIEAGRLPMNRGIARSPKEQMRLGGHPAAEEPRGPKDLFTKRCGASLDEVFRRKSPGSSSSACWSRTSERWG